MQPDFKIELGSKVTDKITKVTGIVTGRAEYLTGCRQYGIGREVGDDGKMLETLWMDEDRLDVHDVPALTLVEEPAAVAPRAATGGPQDHPVERNG